MADLGLNEKLKEFFETSSFTKFLTGFINVPAAKRALTANQWLGFVSQLLSLKWLNQIDSMVIIHVPESLLFKNSQWGNTLLNNQGLLNTTDYVNIIMLGNYVLQRLSATASQNECCSPSPLLQNWCLYLASTKTFYYA